MSKKVDYEAIAKDAKARGLQQCIYLDDLGMKIDDYYTNFCDNTDERYEHWMKEKEEYGFDERETWNLDVMFAQWIYTRFMRYKEICNVDLKHYLFKFTDEKGNTRKITQGEAIDVITDTFKEYIITKYTENEKQIPENVFKLLGDVLPAMWW